MTWGGGQSVLALGVGPLEREHLPSSLLVLLGSTSQTKDGSVVRKCRVADRTGSILFSIWNEEAEAIEAADIIRLSKGYRIPSPEEKVHVCVV